MDTESGSKEVKQVETVVFIPATPESRMKTLLQQQDNLII